VRADHIGEREWDARCPITWVIAFAAITKSGAAGPPLLTGMPWVPSTCTNLPSACRHPPRSHGLDPSQPSAWRRKALASALVAPAYFR
jgi:hypothetical protein